MTSKSQEVIYGLGPPVTLPVVISGNMLENAVSSFGVVAMPKTSRAGDGTATAGVIGLWQLKPAVATGREAVVRGSIAKEGVDVVVVTTSCTLEPPPLAADDQENYILDVAWGPAGICAETLLVCYPSRLVLWTIKVVDGFPPLKTTYCSCTPLPRKPRGALWHPSSRHSLFTVFDALEVSVYSAASPTAPTLLYSIQPQGRPNISACAWESGGSSLVMAAGGEVRLLVWGEEGSVEEGPPQGSSTWLLAQMGSETGLAQQAGSVGRVRALVPAGGGSVLMANDAPLKLTGGGLLGEGGVPLNSTLEELKSSRRRTPTSTTITTPTTATRSDQGSEGQLQDEEAEEKGEGGVIDLVGRVSSSSSAGDGVLGSLLTMGSSSSAATQQQQQQQQPEAGQATRLATLLAMSVGQQQGMGASGRKGTAVLAADDDGLYPLVGLAVPSLVAYRPPAAASLSGSTGQASKKGSAMVAVASETSGVILCLEMHERGAAAAGSNGMGGGRFREKCRFKLPPGCRARGLAMFGPQLLMCYAIKRPPTADTAAPLPSLSSTAAYITELFLFCVPEDPTSVSSRGGPPPSTSSTQSTQAPDKQQEVERGSRLGRGLGAGVADVEVILTRLLSDLRSELCGRLDGIERAVHETGQRVRALEEALKARNDSG